MKIPGNLSAHVINAEIFKRGKGLYFTSPRSYFAISYRISSDNLFTYKNGSFRAKSGDILIVPSEIGYTCDTSEEEVLCIAFIPHNFSTDKILKITPKNPDRFEALFSEVNKIWHDKKRGYEYHALSGFYKIMGLLLEETADQEFYNLYEEAADYIKRNYSNPYLQISDVAENFSVCESLFRQNFKKHIGISPKKYLDKIRIEQAVLLVESGYFTFSEIAEKCGFSDSKYLSVAFKNKMGVSLMEYKKKRK